MSRRNTSGNFSARKSWRITRWKITETWRDAAANLAAYLQMEKDTKEKVTADEMMDDLIYLAELIDFMGITSCLAVRGTLSERMTDKLTDSIAGMADEVLEKWEDYQDKTE